MVAGHITFTSNICFMEFLCKYTQDATTTSVYGLHSQGVWDSQVSWFVHLDTQPEPYEMPFQSSQQGSHRMAVEVARSCCTHMVITYAQKWHDVMDLFGAIKSYDVLVGLYQLLLRNVSTIPLKVPCGHFSVLVCESRRTTVCFCPNVRLSAPICFMFPLPTFDIHRADQYFLGRPPLLHCMVLGI